MGDSVAKEAAETFPYETLVDHVGILEAPTWDGRGGILFSNVTAGGVSRLDLATRAISDVYPHRRGIGGMALTVEDEPLVSGRNVAIRRKDSRTDVLLECAQLGRTVIGFNDLTIAPDGMVVVGALGPGSIDPHAIEESVLPPPTGAGTGAFVEVGRDGHRVLADDIGHPNGVAFAADGRSVYVSDSLRRCVFRFDVDDDGWRNRRVFATFAGAHTDGMAVATDGSLWLALALAGEIVVLGPEGGIRRRITTPVPLTTSCHFGGEDMRTIFVTSGSHTGAEPATLIAMRAPVAGLPIPRARM